MISLLGPTQNQEITTSKIVTFFSDSLVPGFKGKSGYSIIDLPFQAAECLLYLEESIFLWFIM